MFALLCLLFCFFIDGIFPTPNILLIVAEDSNAVPFLDVLQQTSSNLLLQLPGLAKLYDRATLYTRAYATQSNCSPSRSSMLTGLYPYVCCATCQLNLLKFFKILPNNRAAFSHQNGHMGLAFKKGRAGMSSVFGYQLHEDVATLPQLLKESHRSFISYKGHVDTINGDVRKVILL